MSDKISDTIARRAIATGLGTILCTALGVLLCFQLVACQALPASEQIAADALAAQIVRGTAPLILDVRTAEEYAEGHIPGAVNIHFRDIPAQIERIRAFNSDTVIVYCERGVRAGIAEKALVEAGFSSVMQLAGDMPAWRAASFPIVRSVEGSP